MAIWGLVTTAWVLALGLVIGGLLDLPGWSSTEGPATVVGIALAAVLTVALLGWAAFFASVGRGYIAPLAWTVAMVALSQILTVLGWGAWFPWAIPALLSWSRWRSSGAGDPCWRARAPRRRGSRSPRDDRLVGPRRSDRLRSYTDWSTSRTRSSAIATP